MSRMSQGLTRCLGKRSFRRKRDAGRAAGRFMRAYKCVYCSRYHVGHRHFEPMSNRAAAGK